MFKTFKTIFLAALLWLMAVDLSAQAPAVPHLINFQSILADAAGLPLADGLYDVDFKIVDADGSLLYQETQKLETVNGVASAMVGAQGEMDLAKLEPTRTKFLEVEVIGRSPTRKMEIVTVPYSLYAEQSLGVVPKGIGTEAIQTGAITKELLSEELLDELLSGTSTPAKQVDVETNFLYSRGPTVQTVLQDLDTAIHQRQVNMERLRTDVNGRVDDVDGRVDTEETTRSTADIQLQTGINAESVTRSSADTQLQTNINQEQSERTGAVNNLQTQVDSVNTTVGTLTTNQNNTESRLTTVEQNVNTLLNPPRVRAAGAVNFSFGNNGASLAWGYNVASASGCVNITFSQPIATPYIVQVTPLNGGILWVDGMGSNSFHATTDGQCFDSMVPFHFVVFK